MYIDRLARAVTANFVLVTFCLAAHSQDVQPVGSPATSARWSSSKVVYVAGLQEIKPNSVGSLSLTGTKLAFIGNGAEGDVPVDQITAVYIGDQRVATGGTGAKIARHIPVFGFGAAVGAVTNKKVDLLTIEFHDTRGAYHGAVFEIPKTQAVFAQQQLSSLTTMPLSATVHPCSETANSSSLLVVPITSPDVELPAEYRVLVYEQLISQLKIADGTTTFYRVGDATAPCTAKKLQLSVTAFKKGNEALRTSTGPLGYFVGGTSLKFHISIVDTTGRVVFEQSLKESKRGDGDSLSVTRDLARSVSKRLVKANQIKVPVKS